MIEAEVVITVMPDYGMGPRGAQVHVAPRWPGGVLLSPPAWLDRRM